MGRPAWAGGKSGDACLKEPELPPDRLQETVQRGLDDDVDEAPVMGLPEVAQNSQTGCLANTGMRQ
eukprot:10753476-Lingulodinium_polyedra.AAC.1